MERTKVHNDGGKNPQWNDVGASSHSPQTMTFKKKYEEEIYIECWDKDSGSKDDMIGSTNFHLGAVIKSKKASEWIELRYKGKKSGDVKIEFEFFPDKTGDGAKAAAPASVVYVQQPPGKKNILNQLRDTLPQPTLLAMLQPHLLQATLLPHIRQLQPQATRLHQFTPPQHQPTQRRPQADIRLQATHLQHRPVATQQRQGPTHLQPQGAIPPLQALAIPQLQEQLPATHRRRVQATLQRQERATLLRASTLRAAGTTGAGTSELIQISKNNYNRFNHKQKFKASRHAEEQSVEPISPEM